MKRAVASLFALLYLFVFVPQAHSAISFTISNPILGSDGSIEVDANITGLISSSCSSDGCYLQGQFQSSGGYFGATYNNSGEFVDYFRTPSSVEEIKTKLFNFTPISGTWTGKLKVKNNPSNSNYYGSGVYPLSFRRFSGNSTSPTSAESNILVINLTDSLPDPTPETSSEILAPTPTPTAISLKTAPPTPAPLPSPTPVKTVRLTVLPTRSLAASVKDSSSSSATAEVLGTSDTEDFPTASPEAEPKSKIPFLAIIITILGMGLIGAAGFLAYRKQKEKTLIQ